MTELLFTAKAQRKYSMELLSSLRPLRLCGELNRAVYARVQYVWFLFILITCHNMMDL
jgi:hypothetical protein